MSANTVASAQAEGHRASREMPKPRMAKVVLAHVPNGEQLEREAAEDEERAKFGRILRCVQHVIGKNRDEMALCLDVDPRQLGRWYAGTETAQVWRYHRNPILRRTLRLVEALDDFEGATVETTIRAKLNLGTEKVGE